MSAVAALNYDPVFGLGGRQSYSSWSVLDAQSNLLGHDLTSYTDARLSPSTTSAASAAPAPVSPRSIPASPPRPLSLLSPEQREFKRQQDFVRREAKVAARHHTESSSQSSSIDFDLPVFSTDSDVLDTTGTSGRPSTSASIRSATPTSASASATAVAAAAAATILSPPLHSSASSPTYLHQQSSPQPSLLPPVTMADLSAASTGSTGLPGIYATSTAPSHTHAHAHAHAGHHAPPHSLLTEHTTTTSPASLGSPSYMTSTSAYSSSMQDQGSPGVFSYQNPPYIPQYTAAPFASPPPSATLQSQYPRSSLADQQMMYQLPHQSSMMQHQATSAPPPPTHHTQLPPPHMVHPGLPGPGPSPTHRGPPHHSSPHHHHHHPQAPYGSSSNSVGGSTGNGTAGPSGVRIVQSKPKPQCWDHGCNGRQFSTSSNLLRHQREKSGLAAKATCPNCGAVFTRTTARNGHMQHDKCKQRRNL